MKKFLTLAVVAALASTFGCEALPEASQSQNSADEWLVRQYQDDAIKNAVIAQHTLYPYHFAPNGAVLNPLGEHDLGILAEHFQKYPGQVNVRRGDEGSVLYRKRVESVVDVLKKAGIKSIRIADALPGGDGMSSERVVKILQGRGQAGSQGAAPTSTTVTTGGGPK